MRHSLALLSVFAVSSVASAGHAASAGDLADVPTIKIRYDDLDVSLESGAQELHRRIQRAAESVCGTPRSRDLSSFSSYYRCQRDAVAHAVAQVKWPNGGGPRQSHSWKESR